MNLLKQFWFSLYSPKTISRFRLQKIGKTIFFLFLLAILYTLPGFFSFEKEVKLQVNNASDLLKENIQTISLNKGNLTINDNTPFERKIGHYKYALYPNSTVVPSSVNKEQFAIIALKNRIIIKTDKGEQDYPYPSLKKEINKTSVSKFISNIENALPFLLVALFFLFYLGSCFFIFILATIIAFITGLFKTGKKLSFKQRFAMVSYSLTLPTVLYFVLGIFQIELPYQTFFFILITSLMYTLTIRQLPVKK
ncbi:DUF1189 domain-containing protein [Bacillus sp. EAC]|uniref:DUF1189 domain-containing protein n=1 Tax=Bacillus sp. EAC TaxID=1978338 RepID=UPI000B452742|nr:DUF1189 domain-containing protein [Bacillus sp. EAC]